MTIKKSKYNPQIGIRWGRQQHRIEVVHLILECFSHYYMMKNHAQMAKFEEKDFKGVERLSSFFNEAFKQNSKLEDFMVTTDESSNKAIEEYKILEELLNRHFPSTRYPIEKETVMSTLAYLYHDDIILKMKHYDYLFFIQWVEYIYHTRIGGIKLLMEKSIETCIWDGGFIRHADTKLFRRTFCNIEEKLNTVIQKRLERKSKKQGSSGH